MTRPLLPPRGLFTGTRWLFDPALAPNLKETLLQLMTLTWGREPHTTPLLSYPMLEELTGKNARTLRGHLSALRTYHAALRLQHAVAGQFIITLAGWLFRNDLVETPALDGKNLPLPDHDHGIDQQEEQDSLHPGEVFLPPVDDLIDYDQPASAPPPAAKTPRRLSKKAEKRLIEAGVFPGLLAEVATRAAESSYSEAALFQLLEWTVDSQPDAPAGLFISRLRAGARAPAMYARPVCTRCGQRGKHSADCPHRYAMDGS
jgi:hypothetical protein